jgi:hypothetical protein
VAGRDWVVIQVRVHPAMDMLVKRYQESRNMPSKSQAVIELLETHPALAQIVIAVYASSSNP